MAAECRPCTAWFMSPPRSGVSGRPARTWLCVSIGCSRCGRARPCHSLLDMLSVAAAGVAQAAAGVREPVAAAGAAEPSLRNLVESYAQEAGMEFLPKARQHEGLQVRFKLFTLSGTKLHEKGASYLGMCLEHAVEVQRYSRCLCMVTSAEQLAQTARNIC